MVYTRSHVGFELPRGRNEPLGLDGWATQRASECANKGGSPQVFESVDDFKRVSYSCVSGEVCLIAFWSESADCKL
jgi:hypothetical protein